MRLDSKVESFLNFMYSSKVMESRKEEKYMGLGFASGAKEGNLDQDLQGLGDLEVVLKRK